MRHPGMPHLPRLILPAIPNDVIQCGIRIVPVVQCAPVAIFSKQRIDNFRLRAVVAGADQWLFAAGAP